VAFADRADNETWLRARDILAKLDAHDALVEIDRQAQEGAAATVETMRAWAAGEGPRRCLRDPARPPGEADKLAWTACGDQVPVPATTADPAQVQCVGCWRVTGDQRASGASA